MINKVSKNKLVEIVNGWVVLTGFIKYGNTPFIKLDKITDFAYYTAEPNEHNKDTYYILFGVGVETGKRWNFKTHDDLSEVYSDLTGLLFDRVEI